MSSVSLTTLPIVQTCKKGSLIDIPPEKQAKWGPIAQKVSEWIGSVIYEGKHHGWATLIGIDRVVTPFHVIANIETKNLEVKFRNSLKETTYKVSCIYGCKGCDYAIVKLNEAESSLPGKAYSYAKMEPNINWKKKLLFVEVEGNSPGKFQVGFIQKKSRSKRSFHSFFETTKGSSGGPYFDKNGKLVAIHLCQQKEGDKRRGVLMSRIFERSIIRTIKADKPLPNCGCSDAIIPSDRYAESEYSPQKNSHSVSVEFGMDIPSVGEFHLKGYEIKFSQSESISSITEPRGLEIVIYEVLNKRQVEVKSLKFLFTSNVHSEEYEKNASRTYMSALRAFSALTQEESEKYSELKVIHRFEFNAQGNFEAVSYQFKNRKKDPNYENYKKKYGELRILAGGRP